MLSVTSLFLNGMKQTTDKDNTLKDGLIIESLTNYDSGGGDEIVTLKENSRCLTLER